VSDQKYGTKKGAGKLIHVIPRQAGLSYAVNKKSIRGLCVKTFLNGERIMTDNIFPVEGEWYRDNIGRIMQVVAYDEDSDAIEVQLFEGEVTEFDLDSWNQLEMELIEPPEDWSGPFDDLVPDDMGNTEKPMHPTDWNGPADEMDRED
jgi:hypothetical protein